MSWIIRVILFTILLMLVVRAAMRLLGGIIEGASGSRPASPPGTKMVKDPVCGTFVVPSKALTASRGNETAFFCSPECRQSWQRR